DDGVFRKQFAYAIIQTIIDIKVISAFQVANLFNILKPFDTRRQPMKIRTHHYLLHWDKLCPPYQQAYMLRATSMTPPFILVAKFLRGRLAGKPVAAPVRTSNVAEWNGQVICDPISRPPVNGLF